MKKMIIAGMSVSRPVLVCFILFLAFQCAVAPAEEFWLKVIAEPALLEAEGGGATRRVAKGDELKAVSMDIDVYRVELDGQTWYIDQTLVKEIPQPTAPSETYTYESTYTTSDLDEGAEKSWFARNWGWVAGGAAVLVGGGVALAAGGGGGGGSSDSSTDAASTTSSSSGGGSSTSSSSDSSDSSSVEGKWVSTDYGYDEFNFSGGSVSGVNNDGVSGSGSYSQSGNSVSWGMTFAGRSYSYSGNISGDRMSVGWKDNKNGNSGSITCHRR